MHATTGSQSSVAGLDLYLDRPGTLYSVTSPRPATRKPVWTDQHDLLTVDPYTGSGH